MMGVQWWEEHQHLQFTLTAIKWLTLNRRAVVEEVADSAIHVQMGKAVSSSSGGAGVAVVESAAMI